MKSFRLLALVAAASLVVACAKKEGDAATPDAAAAATAADPSLATDAQKFGYAIGVDLATSLKAVEKDVDIEALKQGLDDQFKSGTAKMDQAAREAIKNTVSKKMQERQQAERDEKATKGKAEGEAFLAENAKKEGVKATASGLQYKVITEGKGDKPKASDKVTVHYKGTLINGEEFDSSYARNNPVTFPLQNVIPGWTEGLQLMTVGSKYQFFIPSALGYGERGAGAKIGPNATLVFEVELISIEKEETAKKK